MIAASQQTEEVFMLHLRALGTGNLDALMEDYSDQSVFITQAGTFSGLAQIRSEFERLLAAYPPGSTFKVIQQTIASEYAHIVWSGESTFLSIPFAVDTFVVKDGKIILQTFAGQIIPKAN